MAFERADILGCPVDCISFEDAVAELCERISRHEPTHVVFANVAKVVHMRRDSALTEAMRSAELVLADGVPLTWVAPMLGPPLKGRVNGTDLFERMVAESARRGLRVFFLGATDEILRTMLVRLRCRHPELIVAGSRNGYFSDAEEPEVIRQIAESGAEILFVGMGTPKKELWGARNLHRLDVSICQSVGGSFDVVAGALRRAPKWMRRAGLEWLCRIIQEPGRMWKRYLVTNTVFLWMLIVELIATRLPGHSAEKVIDENRHTEKHRHAA